ncbi:hypothetical protein DWB58_04200, partial [candidate division KSB1 bacterium]|nr:hypothetical protein [candidate division KSB1 bacterium]
FFDPKANALYGNVKDSCYFNLFRASENSPDGTHSLVLLSLGGELPGIAVLHAHNIRIFY